MLLCLTTHGIPGRAERSKEVMGHGQHRYSHRSLSRDQSNLPGTPNRTKRFPTCPAAIAAISGTVTLLHRQSLAFLFCSFLSFLMHLFSFSKKLAPSSLSFSPSPGVQAFEQWPQLPSPPHVHLPWLPRFRCCQRATGASTKREKWPFKGK